MPEDYEITGSGVNDKVSADIGLLMIDPSHLNVMAGQPLVLPRPRRERIRIPLLEQVRRVSPTIDGAHDAPMTAGMGATITRTPTILSTITMGRVFPSTSLPAARSVRATVNRSSEVVSRDWYDLCIAKPHVRYGTCVRPPVEYDATRSQLARNYISKLSKVGGNGEVLESSLCRG